MPRPFTFNIELLKRLVQEHPEWSHRRYADALTEDRISNGWEPSEAVLTTQTVAATISRLRPKWEAEGIKVQKKRRESGLYTLLVHNAGVQVPDDFQGLMILRRLRQLDRLRQGLTTAGQPGEAERVLRWERDLRERREVIDIRPDGMPYTRPAAPWEMDSSGKLIEIITAYRPPPPDEESAESQLN